MAAPALCYRIGDGAGILSINEAWRGSVTADRRPGHVVGVVRLDVDSPVRWHDHEPRLVGIADGDLDWLPRQVLDRLAGRRPAAVVEGNADADVLVDRLEHGDGRNLHPDDEAQERAHRRGEED